MGKLAATKVAIDPTPLLAKAKTLISKEHDDAAEQLVAMGIVRAMEVKPAIIRNR